MKTLVNGKPAGLMRLVSLCMDGLTKISPTQLEVVKTNYEPARDLDVLFVNFTPMEGGQ